ncbi:hypothetical protein JVT61DRAFT_11251 [Boletus reticuloceps]|uniref:DUF6589 domain-containing protein n=1 Tax=Boletus reticuloceps TaxID=495285 RepID=A0A8I3A5K1_9AGAM|nr:hypothetical protein JVT61DRAFT_11251 [Boletus reticuloceps]
MHTPYNVINTLAHLGVSISTDAINMAVRSLSLESERALQSLGHSLVASYAYDNFDVDLKSEVPMVEKSNTSLKHLTSGLLFPLAHGVVPDDLRCSDELWKKSALNPEVERPDMRTWWDLVNLHDPEVHPTNFKPPRYHEFNAWMFLQDLCTHGPEYFRQFKPKITHPEPIEPIPHVKTPIFAARAMDINNSTISGNIRAVIELLKQGGIYESAQMVSGEEIDNDTTGPDSADISQHVILVHGDLGTGEQLHAAQLCRSIEATPWDRFQHVVFIPGLFHLKMACADAIWRCFIQPPGAREDETCLMKDISICRRLNCWQAYVQAKIQGLSSLDHFTSTKPMIDDLKSMADEIVQQFVATHEIQCMRRKPDASRNIQFENSLLMNKYFLLYEEMLYAMNRGDIGQVETCIIDWIPILKATGKHKYATHMLNFMLNVHFVYPPGLRLVRSSVLPNRSPRTEYRRAVRYHLLVNPTGQPMKWRAVDYCVELNNLFTKVNKRPLTSQPCSSHRQAKNGGKGPNRTIERIILESPLVQVYRNIQKIVQTNFEHTHLTSNHAAPNMAKTYSKLQEILQTSSPHIVHAGRKSQHVVDDLSDKGFAMMEKVPGGEGYRSENGVVGNEDKADLEDVLVELL